MPTLKDSSNSPNDYRELIRKEKEERTGQLNLRNCGLTNWPLELFELTWLTHLSLTPNLRWDERNLKYLVDDKLRDNYFNSFSSIPPEIKRIKNLQMLNCSRTGIKEISNLESLTQLRDLYLSQNQIVEIKGLNNLKNLSSLDLCLNKISEIKGLDSLSKLSSLLLWNNQISEIKGLDNLKNLSALFIFNNQISEIKGFDNLTNLSILFLFNNQISEIKGLDKLSKLSFLDLSQNIISEIKGLDNLKNLSILNLSHNKISEIKGLDNLKNLSSLDLSSNQISEIAGLSEQLLLKLSSINLKENPFDKYPITDWANSKVILGYLQSLQKENRVENKHIKLNVVGSGRIGKTQLMNYLCNGKYFKNADPTHGMNQKVYNLKDGFEASIWDFGGQDYHHGTHVLFLRKKDFYVALWRNEPDTRADYPYWLGTARAFATNVSDYPPPLILVQNCWTVGKKADEIAYPDSRKIKQYELGFNDVYVINIEETFNKNNKWTRKWEDFKTDLNEKIIAHAKSFGSIPKKFSDIRQKLIDKPVKEINLSIDIFKKKYAKDYDEVEFAYLIDYLEFAGCVLFFNEIEALRRFIYPNPVYLSDWIYKKVLDIDILKKAEGKITLKTLTNKLKDDNKVSTFLTLANHFQLLFEDPFIKETYVVPQYLPEYKHSFKEALLELLPYTFCLRFPDFMHEGRLFRFMAEYGKFARDSTSYWKYGLLFTHNETGLQILVYYITVKRQIMIHIEDKRGRSEVARELFDYFAFTSPLVKKEIPELVELGIEVKEKKKDVRSGMEKPDRRYAILQLGVQLSTDDVHFFDIMQTQKNIRGRFYMAECVDTQHKVKLDFMTINLLSENTDRKLRIFFSYSHKDEQYRNEMDIHLTMLKRLGRIETWHDRKIHPGAEWDKKIAEQLKQADIVLLMISADFLHSDYIWDHELSIIRKRLENNDGIAVVPIFTRPCDTTDFDMMRFQSAQHDKQSQVPWISLSPNRDQTYTEIAQLIRANIESLR